MSDGTQVLEGALRLSRCGFALIPIDHKAKGPKMRDWPTLATSNEEIIRQWFSNSAGNIGLATGVKSGVFALDVDKKSGGPATLHALIEEHGALPPTPTQRTGGGGAHYLFRLPSQGTVKNAANIAPGIDVRGEGGVIVVSPSVHESGNPYLWLPGCAPWEMEVAEAPPWLLEFLHKRITPPLDPGRKSGRLVVDPTKEVTFTNEPAHAETVVEGCRAIRSVYEEAQHASEWLWKMALSVIGRAEDGRRLAHHMSSLDFNRYSELDTDRALDRVLEMTGPFTCSKFAEESPHCAACTFRSSISTPLQIGREKLNIVRLQKCFVYATDEDVYYDTRRQLIKKSKDFSATYAHAVKGSPHAEFIRSSTAPKVDTLQYLPGERSLIVTNDAGHRIGNTYIDDGISPAAGDSEIWLDHFRYLIPEAEGELDHLLNVIAHTLQRPQYKIRHAILIKGNQRTGKSTIARAWKQMLGKSNVVAVSNTELESTFQGGFYNKQLAVFEELYVRGRDRYNDLKEFISEDEVRTQRKNIDFYRARTPLAILALSNNDLPIMIPEADDGRWFVINSRATPREKTYYEALNSEAARHALAAFKALLLQRPLGLFNPNSPPPSTSAKREMIAESQSPFERRIKDFLQENPCPLVVPEWILERVRLPGGGGSVAQVRDALRRFGAIPLGQIRIVGEERASPWAWRDQEMWKENSADQVRADLLANNPWRFRGHGGGESSIFENSLRQTVN
ncbi:MAG: bifunctional DNA primase/polymerase [Beijerinckiaceae bacterium]|nr:bifunctional DNA primase/polymerase [Beijerinckiaceae bacterium]